MLRPIINIQEQLEAAMLQPLVQANRQLEQTMLRPVVRLDQQLQAAMLQPLAEVEQQLERAIMNNPALDMEYYDQLERTYNINSTNEIGSDADSLLFRARVEESYRSTYEWLNTYGESVDSTVLLYLMGQLFNSGAVLLPINRKVAATLIGSSLALSAFIRARKED